MARKSILYGLTFSLSMCGFLTKLGYFKYWKRVTPSFLGSHCVLVTTSLSVSWLSEAGSLKYACWQEPLLSFFLILSCSYSRCGTGPSNSFPLLLSLRVDKSQGGSRPSINHTWPLPLTFSSLFLKLFRFKDRSHVAQAIFCVTENHLELLDPLAFLS